MRLPIPDQLKTWHRAAQSYLDRLLKDEPARYVEERERLTVEYEKKLAELTRMTE